MSCIKIKKESKLDANLRTKKRVNINFKTFRALKRSAFVTTRCWTYFIIHSRRRHFIDLNLLYKLNSKKTESSVIKIFKKERLKNNLIEATKILN